MQDYWKPNGGGWGTNVRTCNPDTEPWEIVWASTGLNGLMHISAKLQADGSILTNILKPDQDPPRREALGLEFVNDVNDGPKLVLAGRDRDAVRRHHHRAGGAQFRPRLRCTGL